MSWNNGYEKNKFENEQKIIAEQYRKAGASEELISKMYELAYQQFKSERTYREHTEQLYDNEPSTTHMGDIHSKYWWIEELTDATLAKKIKQLPREDLEILTLYVIEGYTQKDIALLKNCSKQNIQKRISKIKKLLK